MGSSTGESSGGMSFVDQFKHQMPELASSCDFGTAVTCKDLPDVRSQGTRARAGAMTMRPYGSTFDQVNAYTGLYQDARRADPDLRRPGSGRCYGWTWENEGYWYHEPEHQSAQREGTPDGHLFCYTDSMGMAVIVWTQSSQMGSGGQPFIGQITSPTREDAFHYFFYVHHHIGM
jgi:hypothetical protein